MASLGRWAWFSPNIYLTDRNFVFQEIRNISVFLDVDRLEAGKFDNNLLQSIRSARNFILVLTPGTKAVALFK